MINASASNNFRALGFVPGSLADKPSSKLVKTDSHLDVVRFAEGPERIAQVLLQGLLSHK